MFGQKPPPSFLQGFHHTLAESFDRVNLVAVAVFGAVVVVVILVAFAGFVVVVVAVVAAVAAAVAVVVAVVALFPLAMVS